MSEVLLSRFCAKDAPAATTTIVAVICQHRDFPYLIQSERHERKREVPKNRRGKDSSRNSGDRTVDVLQYFPVNAS